MMGRTGPDIDTVLRDLERLLAAPATATAAPPSVGAASTGGAIAGDDANSLDMTR
jgi:hypothetical protein